MPGALFSFYQQPVDQQISFGAILRAARKQLACEYLAHCDIRLTDPALHLGYSELAGFSRHFKRWTGMAPQAWRKRQLETSPAIPG